MNRPSPEPVSDTLDLCCGGKKCPKLQDTGVAILVSDVEQSPLPIAISKDDLPRVIAWLQTLASP